MRGFLWLRWFRRNTREAEPREYVLICMRLDEMFFVHPNQIERNCSECDAVVGIYPSGQTVLHRFPKTKIVCNHCGAGRPAELAPGAIFEPFQSRPKSRH